MPAVMPLGPINPYHAYPVNSGTARKSTLSWGVWLMAPQPVRACGVSRIGTIPIIN